DDAQGARAARADERKTQETRCGGIGHAGAGRQQALEDAPGNGPGDEADPQDGRTEGARRAVRRRRNGGRSGRPARPRRPRRRGWGATAPRPAEPSQEKLSFKRLDRKGKYPWQFRSGFRAAAPRSARITASWSPTAAARATASTSSR